MWARACWCRPLRRWRAAGAIERRIALGCDREAVVGVGRRWRACGARGEDFAARDGAW